MRISPAVSKVGIAIYPAIPHKGGYFSQLAGTEEGVVNHGNTKTGASR